MDPFHSVQQRVEYLLREYPALSFKPVLLPVAIAHLIAESVRYEYPAAASFLLPTLYLFWMAALMYAHFYDLGRRHVQSLARGVDSRLKIGKDFCFSSAELQESFERWRLNAPFWTALEYLSLLHVALLDLKFALTEECRASGAIFQPWHLAVPVLVCCRVGFRGRLSPFGYSILSFGIYAYAWCVQGSMLLSGDKCFGVIGDESFKGPMVKQAVAASAYFGVTYLVSPVAQAFVPLKLAVGCVGCVCCTYPHVIMKDGAIDFQLDAELWSLYWICVGVLLMAFVSLQASVRLTQAGMSQFLRR